MHLHHRFYNIGLRRRAVCVNIHNLCLWFQPTDSRKNTSSDSGVVSPAENVDGQKLLQQQQQQLQKQKQEKEKKKKDDSSNRKVGSRDQCYKTFCVPS